MEFVNICGSRNEIFVNGCLMWVNYEDSETGESWYECFWQANNANGATTSHVDESDPRYTRLTGKRKSKPSRTELLRTMERKRLKAKRFINPIYVF